MQPAKKTSATSLVGPVSVPIAPLAASLSHGRLSAPAAPPVTPSANILHDSSSSMTASTSSSSRARKMASKSSVSQSITASGRPNYAPSAPETAIPDSIDALDSPNSEPTTVESIDMGVEVLRLDFDAIERFVLRHLDVRG